MMMIIIIILYHHRAIGGYLLGDRLRTLQSQAFYSWRRRWRNFRIQTFLVQGAPLCLLLVSIADTAYAKKTAMGKKGKVGKNRQDKFYHLAKEQGFRSRASFKLVQLNKRFDFLSGAARGVLDLCAAPGGWMQIARKHMPVHAPCIGIDLVPIRPVQGCVGLIGDITSDSARADLKRALREAHGGSSDDKVDAVLNDGSPNMGKAWLQDAYTQSELTLAALRLASDFLAPGGVFVTKVFRSNDYNSLLFVMNQLFARVNATKPSASRAESAEIYVMCIGYRAPKAIDPRLLNPKYVFKDMGTEPAPGKDAPDKPDLFLNTVMKDMKKRKRHRGGYADGELTLFRRVSVLDFCRSARPVALMVDASQFSFEPHVITSDEVSDEDAERISKTLKDMPETTNEVLSCCEDLKVLARRDFKLLLKWRSRAREALREEDLLEVRSHGDDALVDGKSAEENGERHAKGDAMDEERDSSDQEELINQELNTVRTEAVAKEKRKKRKSNKLRSAIQRKIDMKIILPEAGGAIGEDTPEGLFAINTATRAEKHGVAMTDVPVDDPHDADDEGDHAEAMSTRLPYKTGDIDSTWNEQTTAIEEDLDRWYKLYLKRRKRDKNGVLLAESKERKRITKRKALREAYEKRQGEAGEKAESEEPLLVVDSSESSSDGEEVGDDIRVERGAGQSREAALWFSQPMFQGMVGLSSDDDSAGESDVGSGEGLWAYNGKRGAGMDDNLAEGEGEDFHAAARREAKRMAKEKEKKMAEDGDGFDVVPMERDNDSDDDGAATDSSFHSSDYDTDEKAEMVTIGKRMRQSKTEAREVLDEAYNRYTFDDPIDLPRWFADPDPMYRRRQPPVTKEQVAEMKEYIKSLQAAPTKKEAEAKARIRARATKKLDAVKAKANNIAEQGDVPASSRMRAIETLYKQAMKSGKSGKKNRKKVYQVVRPTGKMNVGKNAGNGRKAMRGVQTTLVDKRLKADKRGLAKANARNKKASKR